MNEKIGTHYERKGIGERTPIFLEKREKGNCRRKE
jgi:hypothetical protein